VVPSFCGEGKCLGQQCLGKMYRDGKGVKQSNSEAMKWYRLAAAQGQNYAQEELKSLDQTRS
jgi:TPR repeat protein